MISQNIVIIGAGPCGIGAAWTLQKNFPGESFLLIDEATSPGGNAGSTRTPEGFTFDCGGHVLYPHQRYKEFGEIITQLVPQWDVSCPIRGVYTHGNLVLAPIQRNVHRLPAKVAYPIFRELLFQRLTRSRKPSLNSFDDAEENFHQYLEKSFGKELTRLVMAPLNTKMWAISPTQMSSVWVRERSGSALSNVPQIKLRRLLCNALLRRSDPGWKRTTRVSYPASGGTGAIWSRALSHIPQKCVRFGLSVKEIKTRQKTLVFSDGSEQAYSTLISSIPLDCLLRFCSDQPNFVKTADGLRKSRAVLFGFGVRGMLPKRFCGVHTFQTPDSDVPFWRVTIPSNVSKGNVPNGGSYYSVLCEVSSDDTIPVNIVDLRRATLDGLNTLGLLSNTDSVCSRFEKVLEHGYPLPFLGRDEMLDQIHQELHPLGIYSRGRFGGWRYEVSNQDHAFMQGVEVVRCLLKGDPESTYKRYLGAANERVA